MPVQSQKSQTPEIGGCVHKFRSILASLRSHTVSPVYRVRPIAISAGKFFNRGMKTAAAGF